MKHLIAIMATLGCILIAIPAVAERQSNEQIVVKKSDLPPELLKQIELNKRVENVGSWVGLGKEIGTAVNEGLSALTKNADEFAKTGVGQFTLLMIAWKVMGWQLVHILGGIGFFVIAMVVFTWSFWLNCRTRRFKVRQPKEGEPVYEVAQASGDAIAFHGVFFVVVTIVTLFIIFSG